MYSFFLQIITVSSLGTILFIFARALPRMKEETATIVVRVNRLDNLIAKIPFEKIDATFNSFFEKTLRKIRLAISRFDNFLTEKISHIRHSKQKSNKTFEISKLKEEKEKDSQKLAK